MTRPKSLPSSCALSRIAATGRMRSVVGLVGRSLGVSEHIKNIQDPLSKMRHEMFFFGLARGATRRIMFFLCIPPMETETRLLPDDKLLVSFDEEADPLKAWTATITEPLPYSPLTTVTGYITWPWDREEKEYKDTRELRMIPWKELKEPKQALSLILKQRII